MLHTCVIVEDIRDISFILRNVSNRSGKLFVTLKCILLSTKEVRRRNCEIIIRMSKIEENIHLEKCSVKSFCRKKIFVR